jgi:hypothetical protein
MPYGIASSETREILAPLGEGVFIEDADFPASESATISVIIEGALDEEFDVPLIVARDATVMLFGGICERYRNVSIEVDASYGPEMDRTQILTLAAVRLPSEIEVEADRDRIISKQEGGD